MLVNCGDKEVINVRNGFGSITFQIVRLLVKKGGVYVISPISNNSRTQLDDELKHGNVQFLVEVNSFLGNKYLNKYVKWCII